MAHFAHLTNGTVDQVTVIDGSLLISTGGWYNDDGVLQPTDEWVQTSYNTGKGEYKLGKDKIEKAANKIKGTDEDRAARNRKNFAALGHTYDLKKDMFIPPKPPFASWKLNLDTGQWDAPKKMPTDKPQYGWDEDLQAWISKT